MGQMLEEGLSFVHFSISPSIHCDNMYGAAVGYCPGPAVVRCRGDGVGKVHEVG